MAKSIRLQINDLAAVYRRHGGKSSRKKQLENLITDCEKIAAKYRCNSVHQIGQKHVKWIDQQLRLTGSSDKTRMDHFYGFTKLWEWLGRSGKPLRCISSDLI